MPNVDHNASEARDMIPEQKLRLECLRLAHQISPNGTRRDVMECAKEYYKFVKDEMIGC